MRGTISHTPPRTAFPTMSWIDRGLPGVGENLAKYLPASLSKHVGGIRPPAIRFYPGHALWYAIMLAWLSPVMLSSMKGRIADRNASLDQSSGQTFKYEKGEIGEAPELTVGTMKYYGQRK